MRSAAYNGYTSKEVSSLNHTIISSAVSLSALQQKLDLIANNIANINTVGYKKQQASFQDVLTTTLSQNPDMQLPGRMTQPGLTLGGGSMLVGLRTDLTQGTLQKTDNPFDLALEGHAMFEIEVPIVNDDGTTGVRTLWTRSGRFHLSTVAGLPGYQVLTTPDGYPVRTVNNGYVAIPNYADFRIDERGYVTYTNVDGSTGTAGQIKLMRVMRPDLIMAVSDNLFNVASGVQDPNNVLQQVNFADASGEGIAVRQYYAEQSNVDLLSEMTELIMVQRAYQLNARALSAGDTMMNLANQLRR